MNHHWRGISRQSLPGGTFLAVVLVMYFVRYPAALVWIAWTLPLDRMSVDVPPALLIAIKIRLSSSSVLIAQWLYRFRLP
jgi:hypothetical protein